MSDLKKPLDKEILFKKFFEYSMDMLCVAGTDGYFKIVNSAFTKILGWSEEELLSRPFVEFVHEDDIQSTIAETEKLAKGVPTISFSNRYKTKEGGYVWMNWTCHPDNTTGDLYAVAHNVTELVDLNIKLRDSLKFKDIFLANMSHEIRTPMNAIIGFTDLLGQTELNEEQSDYLSTIASASQNLLVIINDILDYSKIESGKIDLEQKPISIKVLSENVVKLVSHKLKEKNLKLMTSFDQDIPYAVLGDSVRLTQILVNLLNNSIKFTEKGKVELIVYSNELSDDEVLITFTVKDTGIGIPSEKLGKIFDRFEQASTSTTRLYGGTGLGLSIVKMLVDLQKGNIKVNSKVGEGTEFIVEIPFKTTSEEVENQFIYKSKPTSINQLEGLRVLVAEDNPVNQKLITKYLAKNGAQVELTADGVECIESLKKDDYDVILMDLQMPNMNGREATIEIRKKIDKKIPIIACTADSMSGEKKKCLEIGMNGYIAKPYTEELLVTEIVSLLKEMGMPNTHKNNGLATVLTRNLIELENQQGKEFVRDLVEVFKDTLTETLPTLKVAINKSDTQQIAKVTHKITGALVFFKLQELIDLSKRLESSAKEKKVDNIKKDGTEFMNEIKVVLENLDQY